MSGMNKLIIVLAVVAVLVMFVMIFALGGFGALTYKGLTNPIQNVTMRIIENT